MSMQCNERKPRCRIKKNFRDRQLQSRIVAGVNIHHEGASGIIWSSSLLIGTLVGGAEKSVLCLSELSASPSLLHSIEGRAPGVLEALSTITESSSVSSGGGAKDQIYTGTG